MKKLFALVALFSLTFFGSAVAEVHAWSFGATSVVVAHAINPIATQSTQLQTLEISAVGVPATCIVEPATVIYEFGDIEVGIATTESTTLTNVGNVTCEMQGAPVITPTPSTPEQVGVVIEKTTLAPGETTTVDVTLQPAALGANNWSVTWEWGPVVVVPSGAVEQ